MGVVRSRVQELVEQRIGSGLERGVQVAVYAGGQLSAVGAPGPDQVFANEST